MMLTPEGYRDRLADQVVGRYLRQFGAVVIEGPKWCGKTWTGKHHTRSLVSLADPAGGFAARELALADPAAILDPASAREGAQTPLLIDEWQEAPGLWDAVRHRVDQSGTPGQFVLTGSARPADGQIVHSGAGRIARVRMRTLSAFESGSSDGRCSVAALLDGERPSAALPTSSVTDAIAMAVHGGWPAAVTRGEPLPDLPAEYLRALADVDVPRTDGSRRDPRRVMALLRSLARNNATSVTNNTLAADIGAADADPTMSRLTVSRYLDVLDRVFVVEQVPAWSPHLRSRTRLRTSPKLYLTDPSLAVAGLGATPTTLLRDLNTFG
ncbi:MAG: AAA family ATPase, partial [Micrococcales bacterium]|nr:AAA family ATPase [Micrococcales bacterium]